MTLYYVGNYIDFCSIFLNLAPKEIQVDSAVTKSILTVDALYNIAVAKLITKIWEFNCATVKIAFTTPKPDW